MKKFWLWLCAWFISFVGGGVVLLLVKNLFKTPNVFDYYAFALGLSMTAFFLGKFFPKLIGQKIPRRFGIGIILGIILFFLLVFCSGNIKCVQWLR